MLSASDIAHGTQGAVRFLQRDPGAPLHFDNTIEGCLRSFRVMVVAAPFYALYLALYYSSVETAADPFEIAAVEAMHFVVDWLLYPVLFYEVAKRRQWLANYPRYIAALNWINLPVLVLAVIGLAVTMVVPRSYGQIVQIGLQFLFYYWFLMTTRLSLGIGWPLSIVLLVVNWMPSLMLSLIVDRLLGVVQLPGN